MSSNDLIRRSTLIIPVNKQKFIDKAWLRRADAIQLDLEDSIPENEKDSARKLIKKSIKNVGRGGSSVLVRINSEERHLEADLQASIWNGLHAIVIPKVETVTQVKNVENTITIMEKERNIEVGSIKIGILIETAKGFNNMRELTTCSERIESVNLGTEDFLLDIEAELISGDELFYPKFQTVINAKAAKIQPIGLLNSMINFRDLEGLKKNAKRSYKLGFKGASCIHPSQVEVLNNFFMPSPEEVSYAQQVIKVYEKAQEEGSSATKLDGKMIDTPIAEKAYRVMKRKEAIDCFEMEKDRQINSKLELK